MNERIKIVSNTEVQIERQAPQGELITQLKASFGTVMISNSPRDFSTFDDDGIAALVDCLNCYRHTGSFAALADTSAVPFVGAVRRLDGSDDSWTVMAHLPNQSIADWLVSNGKDHRWITATRLRQLINPAPPKPAIRPYTISEFVAASNNLTRRIYAGGSKYIVKAVSADRVTFEVGHRHGNDGGCDFRKYEDLAKYWTWDDEITPCGIPEPSPAP